MSGWMAFVIGVGMMALVFSIAWRWARRCDNYSLVDAAWAFGIGLTGVLWLILTRDGTIKHWVAGGLITLWSLRLGWHLQRRIRRAHPHEDARYAKLREVWKGRVPSAFFWFFQAQGISVVVLALPFLLIGVDRDSSWSVWEAMGLAVTLMGILGAGLADSQMSAFKASNSDSKAVCQDGLWQYSRHPNYFFESVIWIGFYLFTCGSEWGWAMLHAPAIIIYLLLRVTGIPPTEATAVIRKGEAYRRYQRTTSAFIPRPPRRFNLYLP